MLLFFLNLFFSLSHHKSFKVHTDFRPPRVLVFLRSYVKKKQKTCVPHVLNEGSTPVPRRDPPSTTSLGNWESPGWPPPPPPGPLRLLSRSILCLRKIKWTTSDTRYRQTLQYSQLDQPETVFFQANENSTWQFPVILKKTISSLLFSCTEGEKGCKWRWRQSCV